MAVFAVISLYFSYNVHCLLLGNRDLCSANPLVLVSGLGEPRIRTFFILCLIASALFISYMLIMQGYIKYKSDMQYITPDIQTPKAEGQGQFGTARWLKSTDFQKVFSKVKVDDSSDHIKYLKIHGYDDMKEANNHAE